MLVWVQDTYPSHHLYYHIGAYKDGRQVSAKSLYYPGSFTTGDQIDVNILLTPTERDADYIGMTATWYPATFGNNYPQVGFVGSGSSATTLYPPITAADFNAAVAANVAASLQAAVNAATAPLNAQILALQQSGGTNLQPLIDAGLILKPERRAGAYTIRDFNVLNAIYQAGSPTKFIRKDLDFINIQLLSIRQAVQKMDEVALARANDPNITAIYRTRADKRKEYAARINADFEEYLRETTRIMRYAVDEVRYNQKFNLLSPTLVRDLDAIP